MSVKSGFYLDRKLRSGRAMRPAFLGAPAGGAGRAAGGLALRPAASEAPWGTAAFTRHRDGNQMRVWT